jgi:beta-glucosidase-like glycosyl hydrolase
MWATDAVHGHNNVYGATIFPHNIGLGAARDPDLMLRIGAATAREIAATGMDWTFAPTVAVPRDRRWGRHYEGYADDLEVVREYAAAMVHGLQGAARELTGDNQVIACVKHWVADGGTAEGRDRVPPCARRTWCAISTPPASSRDWPPVPSPSWCPSAAGGTRPTMTTHRTRARRTTTSCTAAVI